MSAAEKEIIKLENMDTEVVVRNGSENGHKHHYWRFTLCALTAPFMIIGFPSHLIFGEISPPKSTERQTKIKTPVGWFKRIFNPDGQSPMAIILTLISFPIASALTAFVVYNLGMMIYQLLILGDTTPELLVEGHDLFRSIPGVIPVLFGWIFGYNIKSFISSFDSTRVEMKNEIDNGGSAHIDPDERIFGRKRRTRKALFCIYFALIFAQTIHLLSERLTGTGIWIEHFVDVMHNLVLPTYCAFCWALASEYEILSNHLELLKLNRVQPTFELFIKIKICFKKIVNHTNQVNSIFKLFICWVFILALISIIGKILFASVFVFGVTSVTEILNAGLGIFGKFAKGFDLDGDGIGDDILGNDNVTSTSQEEIHVNYVRIAFAYYLAAIIQFVCVYYTLNQAKAVNDRARFVHVLTNDYATEVAGQMTPELYNAYRLLKFYMHSTNEQFNSGLLKIPIAGVFPPMKSRIQGYTIRS